ncbi:caspase family protein [Streptomyces sp. VNUA116]|uniref:HD domain-containing protein n=1 Tax=Streptomyces sp. VNUA116 TaxID=3062449 RepID=UPI002674757A|nr:caspase family protein [Streptomyces sp. VNUA116]WKU47896.1 caspase family protein [Streptomyces sp. VNUA116]
MEEVVRRALLIGAARAPGALSVFEPLDEAVEADLDAMQTALEESGYEVETLRAAERAAIGTGIHEAARGIPDGGTLLVYFTGHGIRLGDADYLVPADARAPRDGDWQQPYVDSLLSSDISPYLRASRAGTVLWIIDACRNGLSGTADSFGSRIVQGPPTGRFAVMAGCSAGERSGYAREGSFFTQGLAEALGSVSAPRTVGEVFTAAKAHAFRVARRQGLTQTAWIRYGTELDGEARDTEVCQGRHLLEEWRAAVLDERLWKLAEPAPEGLVPRLQECLVSLVDRCARTVHLAQRRLPDPWADDDFPVRLVGRVLGDLLPEGVQLSAVEVAALLAAPFLHEAAWAERLSQAAEIEPTIVTHDPSAGPHRRHLEQVWDHHASVAEKLRRCWLRDHEEDERALSLWLVHRWIAERFETDEQAVPGTVADAFARALLEAREGEAARSGELSLALCGLAAAIAHQAPLDDIEEMLPLAVRLPESRKPQLLRLRPLAALLRLAAALAADVRTLPDIVAEHLAVSDPVRPEAVVEAVRHTLHWMPDGESLHMDMPCRHHALHAAMTGMAERADRLAAETRQLATELPRDEEDLLTAVPARVTARKLRPESLEDGREAYEVPLLRFHLAQTEVRDLLMGNQLYGDSALAVRELYQNAMDACRYRAMRWKYLGLKGRQTLDWSGEIAIVQGRDERGRYVECRDNGVGMSKEQLMNTFTRAGSRFEQSRTFRREQASWLRLDPSLRLYPNSRFGIGVFSYFMLADEMTIVTRAVSPEGKPAEHALRVDIPSSGSLFRIRRHDDGEEGDGLLAGGTRVRLYLRDGVSVSCTKTLRRLVRLSEFGLCVDDGLGTEETWLPGVLYEDGVPSDGQEAVPGVLWWVKERGAILCDGVATDETPFGYVLNLSGSHAGKLSTNRNTLQGYDREWARLNWHEGAARLPEWPLFTMEWLWNLESRTLSAARAVWSELRGKAVRVRHTFDAHDLDVVGWFHPDKSVTDFRSQSGRGRAGVAEAEPWRAAVLGVRYGLPWKSRPLSLMGFPVPGPGDAELFAKPVRDWRKAILWARSNRGTIAEALRSVRQLRIVHPDVAPPPVDPGDLAWTPRVLDELIAEGLAGELGTQKSHGLPASDGNDLRDLIWISYEAGEPLGKLIQACSRYAPLLRAPVPEVPERLERYVCTREDIDLLYITHGEGAHRSTRRVRHPWDVWTVAQERPVDPREVLDRMARFHWLGWAPPPEADVLAWTSEDLDVLEVLCRYIAVDADGRRTLPWAATVAVAAEGLPQEWDEEAEQEDWWEEDETTLWMAEERLAGCAARLGLVYERRLAEGAPQGDVVPSEEAAILVSLAHENGSRLEGGLDLEALALARPYSMHADDFSAAVDELRAAGISVPENIVLLREWNDLPMRTRFVFSGEDPSWDQNDYPALPTAPVLLTAGAALSEPLGEVWELARREAPRFGLDVPALPVSLAGFSPGTHEQFALVAGGMIDEEDGAEPHFETPRWHPLTAGALARYAHARGLTTAQAFERLALFREIGALVPELTEEGLDRLPHTVPTEHDLIALEHGHRVSAPGTPLTPLDLVSIAGRIGEPVADAWRRIEPYLPLEPETHMPSAPDVIPLWQDFAILSVRLDGRLPALTGRVPTAHVAFAADAIGESQEWVRQRLEAYATLFDLDLDEDDRPDGAR